MTQELLSVEQVASLLGLHVKTVRAYVRDGRLKATRIGKQYRIMREDLEALTGLKPSARERHVDVSTVVHVDLVDPALAYRLTSFLNAAVKDPQSDGPVRIDSGYDEDRRRLRIFIAAGPETVAALLHAIAGIVAAT